MQRSGAGVCHPEKSMEKLLTILVLSMFLFSCEKEDNSETFSATVVGTVGAPNGYYMVSIDQPDRNKQSFICDDGTPLPTAGGYNCRNAICVPNLPGSVKFAGTRISFRGYKDLGRNPIWSSTTAPSDVELYNVIKLP